MKIKDFIELLETLDPEARVTKHYDTDSGNEVEVLRRDEIELCNSIPNNNRYSITDHKSDYSNIGEYNTIIIV